MQKDIISRFKYVRIQGQELAENTMYAKGIFSMCWDLIQNDVMDEEDRGLYEEIDDWFAEFRFSQSRTFWSILGRQKYKFIGRKSLYLGGEKE